MSISNDAVHAIARKLAHAPEDEVLDALVCIAVSAMDDSESGADTCAVVYEQLAGLGIVVP